MKLESELRYAINAAAKVSAKTSSHWESDRLKREAVVAFLQSFPEKRMRANKLRADRDNAQKRIDDCEKTLQKETGLHFGGNQSYGITDADAFRKAGGKLPETNEFTAEQVVKEYAAAKTAAEAAVVLKKYGIVWK